jgi:hypothetical protein
VPGLYSGENVSVITETRKANIRACGFKHDLVTASIPSMPGITRSNSITSGFREPTNATAASVFRFTYQLHVWLGLDQSPQSFPHDRMIQR